MTCAFAVRGALKKFSGVESVDVSLNKGLATVKLKPANQVTPEQLWDVVKKNGFTPKDTRVVVRGEIVSKGGKSQLKVSPGNRTYEVIGNVNQPEAGTITAEGTMIPGKVPGDAVPIRVQTLHP